MKVPSYQSTAPIQNANAGNAAQYQGAGAFMSAGQSGTPDALNHLAGGINKLNGVVTGIDLKRRQEQLELDLLEDMQNFQAESLSWQDNYQQQNQGKNAVNAGTDAQGFYDEKIHALREKWAGNDTAQHYIVRTAGGMALSGIDRMRDYGNKSQEAWKESLVAGRVESFKDVASDWRRSPEEVQEAYAAFAGPHIAYLRSKGLDPTAAKIQTDRVYREAMGLRMEQDFLKALTDEDLDAAGRSLEALKHGDAADFAAQYESGPAGSKAIGYDKVGGTSYGKFQISSKAGTFDNWLNWLDKNGHEKIAGTLRAAGPADTGGREGKMPETWRHLVQSGAITDEMQQRFIEETHVAPALERLPSQVREAVQSDPELRQAVFSTAVQHGPGGAAKLFTHNWGKGDKGAFLDALYADRKTQFSGSSEEVQASTATRLDRERAGLGVGAVSPEKIRAYQNMFQATAEEKLKKDRELQVLGAYSTLNDQIKDLAPDQQDAIFYSAVSGIEDRETRNQLRTMREKDQELIDKKQESLDASLTEDFERQMGAQDVPYSTQLEAASSLKNSGMSIKAYDTLVTRLNKGLNTATKENESATDVLYSLIDGAVTGGQTFGAEDISRYAVANNLTPKQKEDARKYLDEGGKEGFLWKSRTKIGEIYNYYTGHDLKDNPQFFESVRKGMEGKTPTEKALRETVATFVIGRTAGVDISGKATSWWSRSITWNEAKKAGGTVADSWLPDVSRSEKERIIDEAKYMYGVKKTLSDQDVRWIRRRELGIPTPANRLPKEYTNAGK